MSKTERNSRVQARYDELMHEDKHGHYETMFRVVREEVEREREQCAVAAWTHYMDTCQKYGRAPSMWHEWCASDAIRGA